MVEYSKLAEEGGDAAERPAEVEFQEPRGVDEAHAAWVTQRREPAQSKGGPLSGLPEARGQGSEEPRPSERAQSTPTEDRYPVFARSVEGPTPVDAAEMEMDGEQAADEDAMGTDVGFLGSLEPSSDDQIS